MDDDVRRWNRVKQVFQDALERPADEHERFLHIACGDDRELRGEVQSLLLAHAAAGSFAQGAAIEALPPSAAVALRDGVWAEHRLQRGARLGHYEILSAIGKGGMGEVWKARDTTLRREVAIKMLPDAFAQDADRVARLEREATLLASLNHPNIATIHGLEADHGTRFLVLELVEGRTLADRLLRGPIPVEESLKLALQIADALEAAHERGVIHRDLKPANIKVTPDGRVKVLDFGLAKALTSASDDAASLTATPTEVGVIMGTPAYMSPEQARGEAVGRQADIWSFGVVLLELLTGVSPFGRQTTAETLASVLGAQPDYSVLPSDTPANVRHLVRRCLEKDLKRRLRDIGDVRIEVEEALSALRTDAAPGPAGAVASSRRRWRAAGAMALAALVVVVIGGAAAFVWAPWRSATGAGQAVRFEIGESDKMKLFNGAAMAISPDGHWLVFPAAGDDGVRRYWLRSLDTVEARPLPGTEGAFVPAAWSGDSKYVIFTTVASALIKRVDIQGGPPQTLTELTPLSGSLNGATSNKDGVVVFGLSLTQPLFRVPLSGGQAIPITTLAKGDIAHRWPQFLPDGRHFLYLRISADPNLAGVYIGSVDATPEEQSLKRLLASNREAYYARPSGAGSGHLVFLRDATLMAQPFDPVRMELGGEAVPIAEGVASFEGVGYGLFSVSDTGALVYRGGAGAKLALTWLDQDGKPEGAFDAGEYANPAVSPDGTSIAVAIGPAGSRDIWTVDVGLKATKRLTFDPANDDNPVWSPDGKNIAFTSNRTGEPKLYVKPADGSGEERLLTDQPGVPTSWSRDGRFLLFTSASEKTRDDIWVLPDPGRASGASKPYVLLASDVNEGAARISPDGRWFAYTTQESDLVVVFVRPFLPDTNTSARGAKWLVSKGPSPAINPRWSADGRQLLYMANPELVAVDIDTRKGFQAGTPRRLFAAATQNLGWDLAPDGKQFLFIASPNGARQAPFEVVLNWAAALKKE